MQAIRSRDVKGEFDRLHFPSGEDSNDYDLMTLGEIINGKSSEETEGAGDCFPGILPLVHAYLDLIECSGATRDVLNCYLDLVRLRASGELQTAAQWIRGFVTGKDALRTAVECRIPDSHCYEVHACVVTIAGHKDYQKDSVITPAMNDDLIDACLAISDGTLVPEQFLGRLNSRMQMVLQNLAEEEGTSPSSSPSTREEGAAAADGSGLSAGDWDEGNRQRWQVNSCSCCFADRPPMHCIVVRHATSSSNGCSPVFSSRLRVLCVAGHPGKIECGGNRSCSPSRRVAEAVILTASASGLHPQFGTNT
jgi:hypothetical protein